MTRKEAIAAGAMFYVGKVCHRHVELAGERRISNNNCPGCVRDRMKKHRKKNRKSYNRRRRERYAEVRDGVRVPKTYRKANEVVT
jgi:hypothetical protein